MNKLICVTGPTASGKSNLALSLAEKLGTELISADSMQIYKGLEIGTAKPTKEEQSRVRHHMIDIVAPKESFSVAEYAERAVPLVKSLQEGGRVPILVGGTGLYVDSVVYELNFANSKRDESIRAKLEERASNDGITVLFKELAEIDPLTADRIALADRKRIIRALEVYYATGKPLSAQVDERKMRFDTLLLVINRDRAELYNRINARVDEMFEAGLLAEISDIIDKYGTSAFDFQCMQAIGYKEFKAYFSREQTLEETKELIKQHTRNYAKRQLTWFRNRNVVEVAAGELERAFDIVNTFLESEE